MRYSTVNLLVLFVALSVGSGLAVPIPVLNDGVPTDPTTQHQHQHDNVAPVNPEHPVAPAPEAGFVEGQVYSVKSKAWREGPPDHELLPIDPPLGTTKKAIKDNQKYYELPHPFIPTSQSGHSGEIVQGHVVTRKPLAGDHLDATQYGDFKEGARVLKKLSYVHVNDLEPAKPNTPTALHSEEKYEQLKVDVNNPALVHPHAAPAPVAPGKGKGVNNAPAPGKEKGVNKNANPTPVHAKAAPAPGKGKVVNKNASSHKRG